MILHSSIRQVFHTLRFPTKDIVCMPLAGDASNRRYFRIPGDTDPSGTRPSLILMELNAPEGFGQSEEAGASPVIGELPFVNVWRHLRHCGVAVPEVVFHQIKEGWLLLEDLGDVTLASLIKDATPDQIYSYYRAAIDELLIIHRRATKQPKSPSIAHARRFDQALFMWEFDHFIEYGIEKLEGRTIPDDDKNRLRAECLDLSLCFSLLPRVFTHRDYHSRNLMIQRIQGGNSVRVIDFQDALMGPCQYDLASLLKDSYITLPETMVGKLVAYYCEGWQFHTGEKIEPPLFREMFDLIGLQRNMKAAGRFVYIAQVKKNDSFLQYIPPTLEKIRQTLDQYPRLAQLRKVLSKYVDALQ